MSYEYSRVNIEMSMEFTPFCDSEMQYRIQYPKHWSVSVQTDSTLSRRLCSSLPAPESGIQEC